jgi:hypothetical protein
VNIPEDTIAVRTGEQLDWSKIEHYLRTHLSTIGAGTITVRQFPSGASNLTYLVRIGDWEGVLRRPPFGPIPPKAHDMQPIIVCNAVPSQGNIPNGHGGSSSGSIQ